MSMLLIKPNLKQIVFLGFLMVSSANVAFAMQADASDKGDGKQANSGNADSGVAAMDTSGDSDTKPSDNIVITYKSCVVSSRVDQDVYGKVIDGGAFFNSLHGRVLALKKAGADDDQIVKTVAQEIRDLKDNGSFYEKPLDVTHIRYITVRMATGDSTPVLSSTVLKMAVSAITNKYSEARFEARLMAYILLAAGARPMHDSGTSSEVYQAIVDQNGPLACALIAADTKQEFLAWRFAPKCSTYLHFAAARGLPDVVEVLCQAGGAKYVNIVSEFDKTTAQDNAFINKKDMVARPGDYYRIIKTLDKYSVAKLNAQQSAAFKVLEDLVNKK